MNEIQSTQCRYFVTYSGVTLPLKLINPLDESGLENRITYFCAHYDEQDRMIACEKVVYGEIEFTHRYEYYSHGGIKTAEIIEEDEDPRRIHFDEQGNMRSM